MQQLFYIHFIDTTQPAQKINQNNTGGSFAAILLLLIFRRLHAQKEKDQARTRGGHNPPHLAREIQPPSL